ncbi:hypothetical protein BS50DRAFT_588722 [Corynespora cassiicola Philippines]|uniref:Uncharacterized protein n=1 Tax=Corynespora cassiicola Philippines TaxID=1448308 RepID=A0A2T2NKF7_CORCC|nr:hypothetical protein BS50DRAFT_588722 [Corynespora cassiicola Philippines]
MYDKNCDKVENAFSATLFTRHFIRSMWEEWISRNIADTHESETEDLRNHRGPRAFECHGGSGRNGVLWEYQQLVAKHHEIRLDKKAMKTISWAFRNQNYQNKAQADTVNPETIKSEKKDDRICSLLEERLQLVEG